MQPTWWSSKPLRLVQTNIREIDANLDPERLVESIQEFGGNALLFNTGGIIANYDTKLDYHYRNPYCTDPDLIGKVARRCRENGIRYIARFDFSKINEKIADTHPDWLYKGSVDGHVNYNGQVQTCVNGFYQQEGSLAILEEACERFPIDAVFFNMIGYKSRDYSGIYHGTCQCDNCRRRFKEMYGYDIPGRVDRTNLESRLYEEFKEKTSAELNNKIIDFVHRKFPGVGICQWSAHGTDLVRKESNSGYRRPQPEYVYVGTENVNMTASSWEDRAALNCVVHFIDFPYRHAAVSPALTCRRTAQSIASAGSLDFYVIGHLDNQDDRACLNDVREMFRFHARHEEVYTDVKSVADIAILGCESNSMFGTVGEMRGINQILSQEHIPVDFLHESVLHSSDALRNLSRYRCVILPDARILSSDACEVIDSFVERGGMLLATGQCATYDGTRQRTGGVGLRCSGIAEVRAVRPGQLGDYFRISAKDKSVLKGFENLDVAHLSGEVLDIAVGEQTRTFLNVIPVHMFGPPEKCYYKEELDVAGVVVHDFGKGRCAYVPWGIGDHYQRFPTHAHGKLVVSMLRDLLQYQPWISTDLPPVVELHSQVRRDRKWQLVSMVNLSGQNGRAVLDPIRLRGGKVRLKPKGSIASARALVAEKGCTAKEIGEGFWEIDVPEVGLFETIVLELEK